ncbi:hypothetical protein D3C84_666750 [compost metagenome]
MGDVLEAQGGQLVFAIAEHLAESTVDPLPAPIQAHQGHADGGVVHGVAKARLAGGQLAPALAQLLHGRGQQQGRQQRQEQRQVGQQIAPALVQGRGIEQAEGDDQAAADRGQGHQQRGAGEGQAHGGDHQRQGQVDEGKRQEQ